MVGEMIYILQQRLEKLEVNADLANEVLNKIIGSAFYPRMFEEIMKQREIYARPVMQMLFEKLAHSSTMRINAGSMEKLYELMLIHHKCQIYNSIEGKHLLLISLNHLDELKKCVTDDDKIISDICNAYSALMTEFGDLLNYEFHMIKSGVLSYLTNDSKKMMMLIALKRQNEDGSFILFKPDSMVTLPVGGSCPGSIKYYDGAKICKTTIFEVPFVYEPSLNSGIFSMDCEIGKRGTDLGVNMYKKMAELNIQEVMASDNDYNALTKPKEPEGDELKLLSSLFGTNETDNLKSFHLDIFESDPAEGDKKADAEKNVPKTKNVLKNKKSLSSAMEEMNIAKPITSGVKKGYMLDMMDEATNRPKTTAKPRERSASVKKPNASNEVKAKPVSRPASKSISRPDSKLPPLKSDPKPSTRPESRTTTRPDSKSSSRPDSKSLTRPESKTASRPTSVKRKVIAK
uniref:DH domain-containing protein n=1 Tax=Rhabditophanes sp. KR3021 TaxID=114890 RepID=A0AC35UDH8_9BILA